jgi:hypothetical protein
MVQLVFPWIFYIHCVGHEVSLILKDVFTDIDTVVALVDKILEVQHHFDNIQKHRALLQEHCKAKYGNTRAMIWPAETRFAGRLLQVYRFLSLREALVAAVSSEVYCEYGYVGDAIKEWILSAEPWAFMEDLVGACTPILKLLRMGDQQQGCLTKLHGVVLYVKDTLQQAADLSDSDTSLQSVLNNTFKERLPELVHDVSVAGWIIDPQMVRHSKNANGAEMEVFWCVIQKVLKLSDEAFPDVQAVMVVNLHKFRTKLPPFNHAGYWQDHVTEDCAQWWASCGAGAPYLQKVGKILGPLVVDSGSAD